jgi:hypothetical protein
LANGEAWGKDSSSPNVRWFTPCPRNLKSLFASIYYLGNQGFLPCAGVNCEQPSYCDGMTSGFDTTLKRLRVVVIH